MKNAYKVGEQKLINDNKLTLKNIKTWNGREGIGCQANIYFMNKKVGTFLDEANGGEYYIDFDDELFGCADAIQYIKSLPKFSHNEWCEAVGTSSITNDNDGDNKRDCTWKWYWCDALLQPYFNKKTYNKWLKNIVVFKSDTKTIAHYKAKAKQLTEKFNTPNGIQTGEEYFGKIGIILNTLPKSEAYEYFDKYSPKS